ncbi:ferrochelatase [Acinetobacter larvae]|uniref:Ferrochelatase n=1 Tax=Acinetobacter larvae TaxID=1789224 RepID=A0A1B2M3P5_9GAMM|nr:ferrochelatase [Acinetobacter larvae]AOA59825.1 ferrochelatase [Acinetobacter larvae]
MSVSKARVLVIVANLGTPDAPTPSAVRRFLKQFLSDQRVIELPKFLWWIILNAAVLPFRPKRVAEAYAKVWRVDSPMREILEQQVAAIQQQLSAQNSKFEIDFVAAMRYGKPGLEQTLAAAKAYDHLIVLPLFPQYSATSTAPIYDVLARWILQQRSLPGLSVIRDYYQHPLYIEALADSIRRFQQQHGVPEKLLMSFHGIPQPYADKGDPYPERCRKTAQAVATRLNLAPEQWAMSFQSRFGRQEWVKPYTDALLQQWAEQGIKRVQIMSPAFSADCLETLEELALQNAELFLGAGGEEYAYIPALNTDTLHIDLLSQLIQAQLDGLKLTLQQPID